MQQPGTADYHLVVAFCHLTRSAIYDHQSQSAVNDTRTTSYLRTVAFLPIRLHIQRVRSHRLQPLTQRIVACQSTRFVISLGILFLDIGTDFHISTSNSKPHLGSGTMFRSCLYRFARQGLNCQAFQYVS